MLKKLLFFPPVLIGIAILYYLSSGSHAPERKPIEERARVVRVITATPFKLVPYVSGFGTVYPETVWHANAQVTGEIVYVYPDLKKGAILAAGTEVVRISPADFKLAVSQAKANIRSAQAKLSELQVSETNTSDLLKIEKRGLELREAELDRKKKLLDRGTVAQSAFDLEQRETFAQRKKLQDLENTLRLLPTQRAVQQEQIAVYQAQLESAKLDLERTRIKLPFDARIAEVNVEKEQFVQTGSTLVTADSLDIAEVEAQIPISRFRTMIHASAPGNAPQGINVETLSSIIKSIGFDATVKLVTGDDVVEWPARFARISDTIDLKTRTIGVIVAVDGAYNKALPGKRPPLSKGMFVEIELRTRAIDKTIVVPRSAIHNDRLYIANSDNRLEIREIVKGLVQDDLAVIKEGIQTGERIIVSDLIPAISGMLLRPEPDQETLGRIKLAAERGIKHP